MKLPQGRQAGRLVLEVRKGAIALGYQEERLEAFCLLANVVDKAHQTRLRGQVSDPHSVAYVGEYVNLTVAVANPTAKGTYRSVGAFLGAHGSHYEDCRPLS